MERTVCQLLSSALIVLPYTLFTGGFEGAPFDAGTWGLLILIGLVHTALAYRMYFDAIAHLSARMVSMLSYLDPLVAVILSALLLKEPMSLAGWAGCILILGASVLMEHLQENTQEEECQK